MATMMDGWRTVRRGALITGATLALLLPTARAAAVPLDLTVTSTSDAPDAVPGDGICAAAGGACTLRAAIEEANTNAEGATIGFALTGSTVISPASPLPESTTPLVIDGASQACGTYPCVRVDGAAAGPSAPGIVLGGDGGSIDSLVVTGFGGTGVLLTGNNNVVRGSSVGHASGEAAPNGTGIWVQGTSNDVGGTGAGEGNVISGNQTGVIVAAESSFARIRNNRIGTAPDGLSALPNAVGVSLLDSTDVSVGGPGANEGNLISGNSSHGVVISGDFSFGNTVRGNVIGLNATGVAALANGGDGIRVEAPVTDTVIGGTAAGARNVLSGNGGAGVMLAGADFSLVQGNYVGLDVAGTATIGQYAGIVIDGGDDNVIGGFGAAAGNVIAGNGDGVQIVNGAQDNLVYRNTIGARPGGTVAAPNTNGLYLASGASGNSIGSTGGDGNLIAFNLGAGVVVDGATSLGNRIRHNSIHSNGGLAIDLTNGGNGGIIPPVITAVSGAGVSGVACSGCSVDVFSDAQNESRTHVGSAQATIGGAWSLAVAPGGPNVTATATDTLGDSSEVALWDTDGDGVGNGYPAPIDNCAAVANASQANTDAAPILTPGGVNDITVAMSDALGDACDDDDDNDGILDAAEPAGCNASGPLDPLLADTDGDRTRDGAECAMATNPGNAASKPPGIASGESDNDGLSNALEALLGSSPTDSDSDDDGLNDGVEFRGYSTSPILANTDGDGCPDDAEAASLNLDRAVNALDLVLVATSFGLTTKPAIDVNKDGTINALDLVLVAVNFTGGPCPP